MKKIALFSIILSGIMFTSCKDTCYECSTSTLGVSVNVDICDDKYTVSDAGVPTTTNNLPDGTSEKEYAESLEAQGYSCSKK
jgi:hypothetical protein